MNKWSMQSRRTRWTCTFTNSWACQIFQHASKEQHAKASLSEPRNIEDSTHFTMRRWSYDTPWRHPSPNNIVARHALQQQHKCTRTVMSSHVESCHPHLHYGLCCQSMWCNVEVQEIHLLNIESCKLKSHGSRTVMMVVKQPQGSVSPLAINTPSFVHAKEFFTSNAPHLGLVIYGVTTCLGTFA